MKLFEAYNKALLNEFLESYEPELLNEIDSKLSNGLDSLDEYILSPLGIDPGDSGKYFIAGSSVLYVYDELRGLFDYNEAKHQLGDVDVIIPTNTTVMVEGVEQRVWDMDLLSGSNGNYRTTINGIEIELFDVWDPSRGGDDYSDVKVSSTEDILRNATKFASHWFMSFKDVIDYKSQMNRGKESDILKIYSDFNNFSKLGKMKFLIKVVDLIGMKHANKLLKINVTQQDYDRLTTIVNKGR